MARPVMRCSLSLLLPILAGILSLASAAPSGASAGCSDGLRGECNSCVCCCYRGGIPKYRPTADCQCKAEFGGSFLVMIITAGVTLVTSIFSQYYFGGNGKLSPYFPETVPMLQDHDFI